MLLDLLIKFIADFLVIIIVLLAAWALIFKIPKGHRFAAYSRILMAGLTAYLLAKFAASMYQPSDLRPFQLMGVEAGASYLDNPGFPSDHALFVTAIALAVWFETKQRVLGLVLFGLVALVGLGRIVALVHTPLDVIGGVLFALIGALWYSTVPRSQRVINARPKKEHGNGKSRTKPATSYR